MDEEIKRNQKLTNVVSITAVIANVLLAIVKVSVGLIFNSMAVLADGIDTTTDILTSSTVLISSLISRKPPDREHPYGHQRA
ncbi:MAG TPA: cation transporter, partial [Fervidobacterium sp.]|nr:cation transporter [Fervidobacterium sp.]